LNLPEKCVMTNEVAEVLISGIALGSIYAVMSVGMTLVYGVSRVFNWAYGSFFMWGAYLAWLLFSASPAVWGLKGLFVLPYAGKQIGRP